MDPVDVSSAVDTVPQLPHRINQIPAGDSDLLHHRARARGKSTHLARHMPAPTTTACARDFMYARRKHNSEACARRQFALHVSKGSTCTRGCMALPPLCCVERDIGMRGAHEVPRMQHSDGQSSLHLTNTTSIHSNQSFETIKIAARMRGTIRVAFESCAHPKCRNRLLRNGSLLQLEPSGRDHATESTKIRFWKSFNSCYLMPEMPTRQDSVPLPRMRLKNTSLSENPNEQNREHT